MRVQLDKGRLIVLIVAGVSIAVWLTVFPLILVRGPAGAFSGEEGGVLCLAGGEAHADTDLVRFVRRFHYMGVRSEVKTGRKGELCFLLSLARRVPQAAEAVVRKGELRMFPLHPDQAALFPEGDAAAAGLTKRTDGTRGPEWTATSSSPVARLIERRRHALPGPAYVYCRYGSCTGVVTESEPLAASTDVMAAFPIQPEGGEPSILLRLTPPALQRITARGGGPEGPGLTAAFVIDDRLLAVAKVPPPKADGQVTVPLDRAMPDVKFEAAILASILSSGPIQGNWGQTELRLSKKPQ